MTNVSELPPLQVNGLRVDFGRGSEIVHAVRDVTFHVDAGETLAIVGESGCGKSVTALSILGLLDSNGTVSGGSIQYRGKELTRATERELQKLRGASIAMIFQDPMTALNPTMTVGEQIAETLVAHQNISRRDAYASALNWLTRANVSTPERRMQQYPHELSGGIRQRIMIAIAFSCRPEVLIADEPTTALDVTVQAQILDLLEELQQEVNTSVVLITHDLGIVAERADRVAVMYAGQIVEMASAEDFFREPKHPYSRSLLASVPDWRMPRQTEDLITLSGQPPSLRSLPCGCPFAPRCQVVTAICPTYPPPLTDISGEARSVRCVHFQPELDLPLSV